MSGTFRPLAATFAFGTLLLLAGSSRSQPPAAAPEPAAKTLSDPILDRMKKDVFFLASPECEGRGIETKGIEKAAAYVEENFKKAGLKPAMKDGSYYQPFTIVMSSKLGKPVSLTLTGPD